LVTVASDPLKSQIVLGFTDRVTLFVKGTPEVDAVLGAEEYENTGLGGLTPPTE
jgi:hypothetical protein